jgi:molecular chaperone HscB
MICWKCHEPTQGPVCPGCAVIQPPRPDLGFFDVLGLERRYHIAPADVEKAYRKVSRQVHPDRFAGKSAVERRMSLQWTATVNEARRVLKDDLTRARYLATGKAQAPELGGPQLDSVFLEEMFELQMNAREDPDGVRDRANTLKGTIEGELDGIFTRWEAADGTLDTVDECLARLNYLGTALRLVGN